ncbi:DUF6973 domain-containing protein [Phenylobacterium sp.]|uniref:DUF6973 domain-containing protein n=1 Tax=Phenylobacterium sp. TaxID=1871053 RepID=UPI002810A539|nr:hypothetical protein [Phenylobacterium sp.]
MTLEDHLALARAPRRNPHEQWWNLPAKKAEGERIAKEEAARAKQLNGGLPPHNTMGDAVRHARWSKRMAEEIDPVFARLAGAQHEADNLITSVLQNAGAQLGLLPKSLRSGRTLSSVPQTFSESLMDMRNNAEGLRAARGGRAIDPAQLQPYPTKPTRELVGRNVRADYDERGRPARYRQP